MKQSKFGIVITAYNRAVPLKHLLETLNAIKTEIDNIPLIISIDNKVLRKSIKLPMILIGSMDRKRLLFIKKKKITSSFYMGWRSNRRVWECSIFRRRPSCFSYVLDYVNAVIDNYSDDMRICRRRAI